MDLCMSSLSQCFTFLPYPPILSPFPLRERRASVWLCGTRLPAGLNHSRTEAPVCWEWVLFKDLLGTIPLEKALEARESWLIFKDLLSPSPGATHPNKEEGGLKCQEGCVDEQGAKLKHTHTHTKKACRGWKQGWVTSEEYRDVDTTESG